MSYMKSESFKEWRKTHIWNEDYIPISGANVNSDPFIVFYHKGDEYPYSVQYRGNGHYFKTLGEAERYVEKRFNTWISVSADDFVKLDD